MFQGGKNVNVPRQFLVNKGQRAMRDLDVRGATLLYLSTVCSEANNLFGSV